MAWAGFGVFVAGLAFIAGWLVGRRGCVARAAQVAELESSRTQAAAALASAEGRITGLVGEGARLRADADRANQALATALVERGRIAQQVDSLAFLASRVTELEAALQTAAGLRSELDAAKLDAARAARAAAEAGVLEDRRRDNDRELRLRDQYIETLQRELTLRDEQLIIARNALPSVAAAVAALEGRPGGEQLPASTIDLTAEA